jgi:hypothetical protein
MVVSFGHKVRPDMLNIYSVHNVLCSPDADGTVAMNSVDTIRSLG